MRIEREILVAASPATVYAVVSEPAHITTWWSEHAEFEVVPGAAGTLTFVRPDGDVVHQVRILHAIPPRLFSFSWGGDDGDDLTVTIEITPTTHGSRLLLVETGFDERDALFADHETGWDYFLPRLEAVLQ